MPSITIIPYKFSWHYNEYANRYFVSVYGNGKCLIPSRKLVHGIWPLVDGMVQDVDYSRVQENAPLNLFDDLIRIDFYKAYPVDRSVDEVCSGI